MAKKSLEEEGDAIDLITDCMLSFAYLIDVSTATFSASRNTITLGQFYDAWRQQWEPGRVVVPFNQGAFLGFLYVGILFAKENWFDLVPADRQDATMEEWGLKGAPTTAPKEPAPTARYIVRRIRNSLGHGYPISSVSKATSPRDLLQKATITFHDVNIRDRSDTFDAVLTYEQLVKLVKTFQNVIHKHVGEKKSDGGKGGENV